PNMAQTILMFVLSLPLLATSSIYTANFGYMYSGLGTLAETLSYANFASTIGMMVGIGLVLKIKPYFKSKVAITFTFITLALLSLAIGYSQDPLIIIAC